MNKTKNKAAFRTQNRALNSKPQAKCPHLLLYCCFVLFLFSSVNNTIKNDLKRCHTKTHSTERQSKMRKQHPQILLCWLETNKPALHLNWHGSGLPTWETKIQIIVCIPRYKLTNHFYLCSENTTKVISMYTYSFENHISNLFHMLNIEVITNKSQIALQLY